MIIRKLVNSYVFDFPICLRCVKKHTFFFIHKRVNRILRHPLFLLVGTCHNPFPFLFSAPRVASLPLLPELPPFINFPFPSNNITIKIAFLSAVTPGPDLFFRKGNVRCQDLANPAVPWMPSRNLPLTSSSVFPSSDLPYCPRHLFGAEK